MSLAQPERSLIDFQAQSSSLGPWHTVSDEVMGGSSSGEFLKLPEGVGCFRGNLSLENSGGFASVRSELRQTLQSSDTGLRLQVCGDGRRYSFRVRQPAEYDGISYRADFDTVAGQWLSIELLFPEFEAVFRGRALRSAQTLQPEKITQLGFLIADRQAGAFQLLLHRISVMARPAERK